MKFASFRALLPVMALVVLLPACGTKPELAVEDDTVLVITWPKWPGNVWRYRVPEYVISTRDAEGRRVAHPVEKSAHGGFVFSGVLYERVWMTNFQENARPLVAVRPAVHASYRIAVQRERNAVLFKARVTNTGSETWDPGAYMTLCLKHIDATDFFDTTGAQTYVVAGGEFVAVEATSHAQARGHARRLHRAHLLDAEYERWIDRDVFAKYFDGSEIVSEPLIVRSSRDGGRHVAIAWKDARHVSYNLGPTLNCTHSEPRAGALSPGETRTMSGRIFFVEGSLDDVRARYRKIFSTE